MIATTYRVHEFAELAGITVRTLHHYDRLGLLKPRRNESGYRLYSVRDLERLEQIVALKFVGLPLQQIKALLDRNALELRDALANQRRLLEEKRGMMERAIAAIRDAEAIKLPNKVPDHAALRKIIEVIEMQNNSDWAKKYYDDESQKKIERRREQWDPELQEQVTKQWTELFAEVEKLIAKNADPQGKEAQALAARWTSLVEQFTGGDPGVTKGLNKLYQDRQNWPATAKQQMAPFSNPQVCDYMNKAIEFRKSNKKQ